MAAGVIMSPFRRGEGNTGGGGESEKSGRCVHCGAESSRVFKNMSALEQHTSSKHPGRPAGWLEDYTVAQSNPPNQSNAQSNAQYNYQSNPPPAYQDQNMDSNPYPYPGPAPGSTDVAKV